MQNAAKVLGNHLAHLAALSFWSLEILLSNLVIYGLPDQRVETT